MIFHKTTGDEIGVSTGKYAQIRKKIGKTGKWKNYKIKPNRIDGSYRYFGDQIGDGVNYFLQDLKLAMTNNPTTWRALSFPAFQKAMERQQTAEDTTIITARGHNAESLVEAFRYLKTQGYLKNVPSSENIWTVTNPNFDKRFRDRFEKNGPSGDASSPSARKAAIMEEILDTMEKTPLPKNGKLVLSPDGISKGTYHLWGFSDDDYGNFDKARKVIQEGLNTGRWRKTKVTLYFTGEHDPDHKPHTVVLNANKAPRPIKEIEKSEWLNILEK